MKKAKMSKNIPADGATITASPGNVFTRVHLDLADDGITLAMVGAASAAKLSDGNRHSITLGQAKDGLTLAVVGAASAISK